LISARVPHPTKYSELTNEYPVVSTFPSRSMVAAAELRRKKPPSPQSSVAHPPA